MFRRGQIRGERGETLLELLVSITILGVCVAAIGSGIAMSVKVSAIHRSQATASEWLHDAAESLESQYTACTSSYVSKLPSTPTSYNTPSAPVRFWDTANGTFDLGTCPSPDPGLQQVKISLTSTGGQVTESLTVILRSPS